MNCANCKTTISATARFCPRCGTPIKTRELTPAGAARAHADLRTQKMPRTRIGPYRVLRVLRPDDNVYIVEADQQLSGDPPKTRLAIEASDTIPSEWENRINKMATLRNIVKVWGQLRDERDAPFIIVDFVTGDPLDRMPVPLSPQRALNVGLQLTTIVDYMHQNGFTFNLPSSRGNQSDSLKRFQKAFLLDNRDQLYLFDPGVLVTLPDKPDKQNKLIREDILRIIRTFVWIATGYGLGRVFGFLKEESSQLVKTAKHLIKNPPTNARNLAGAFTQMLPPLPSPSATVKLADRAPKPMATLPLPPMLKLVPFAQTDVGKQREHNEDNYLMLPMDASSGLFVVADGMGGQAAGEVASQLAIDAMRASAQSEWAQLTPMPTLDAIRGYLNAWIQRAHAQIVAKARAQNNNMGSTLTAALIWNRQIFAANIGDSRTYLLRGDELYPLTWDHSLVASLVRAGLLEPEAAYDHPQRNEIFRSLGQQGELKIDIFEPIELGKGDQILLCSDGLWEMVRPAHLKDILTRNLDLATCCAELIRAANDQGGDDNITVVLIRIE